MYCFKCACLNLWSYKKNSIILFLSILFGMILPSLVFGQLYYHVKNQDTIGFENQDRVYQIDMLQTTYFSREKLDEMQQTLGVEKIALSETVNSLQLCIGDKLYAYQEPINFYSDAYNSMKNFRIVKGKLPKEAELSEEHPICVVNALFAKSYGVNVGDHMRINGIDHEIAAIRLTIDDSCLRYLSLPYREEFLAPDRNVQQAILVKLGEDTSIDDVLFRIGAFYPEYQVVMCANGRMWESQGKGETYIWLLQELAVSSFVFLFSVVNMILVTAGNFERRKRSLAIHIMLGATEKEVLDQFFAEMFLLLVAAVLALSVIAPLLSKIMFRSIAFGWQVFAGCFVLGLLILLGVNMTQSRKLRSLQPSEVLRQVI